MKHAWIALFVMVALVACKESGLPETQTTGSSQSPSTATADPTTTGASGGSVSSLAPEEKGFLSKAGMGGLAGVKMGTLALERATNPDVKAFAQRVVTDHSKANAELSELTTAKGAALPTELEGEHEGAFRHLLDLNGAAFDKAFMDHMVSDHEKDVAAFQDAANTATDADVKAWAAKTLPALQQHLALAKAIRGKV